MCVEAGVYGNSLYLKPSRLWKFVIAARGKLIQFTQFFETQFYHAIEPKMKVQSWTFLPSPNFFF